jgi:hypothetical protein
MKSRQVVDLMILYITRYISMFTNIQISRTGSNVWVLDSGEDAIAAAADAVAVPGLVSLLLVATPGSGGETNSLVDLATSRQSRKSKIRACTHPPHASSCRSPCSYAIQQAQSQSQGYLRLPAAH